MAYFVFHTFNHTDLGTRSLEDLISIVSQQLRALGHRTIWDPKNIAKVHPDGKIDVGPVIFATEPDAYNVIIEGFNVGLANVVHEMCNNGVKIICLATEEPTPRGFNHGTDPFMVERQRDFMTVGHRFEAIWHLVPGAHVTSWYGQFAPSFFVELGYAPKLMRISPFEREPIYDFGFFGTLSERRDQIFKTLQKRSRRADGKSLLLVNTFPSQAERDKLVKLAKVIIQVRKTEQMGLVSSSRCNTSLCLGRPVIAEPHDLSHPWDEVVTFAKTLEEFYNLAIMARGSWKSIAAAQLEKFKTKLTPEFCLGAALQHLEAHPVRYAA